MPPAGSDGGEVKTPMAVIETPAETVDAAADSASTDRPAPAGLAAVLGSADHKVIGRLYAGTALLFGLITLTLGTAFAVEGLKPSTLDVFTTDTAFQSWTLFRVGLVFLFALPLTIGVAMAIAPLQVGARTIAFPRAAAASYWGWLMGSGLLIASYLLNGGPGGGRESAVNLWIAAMGLLVVAVLTAAMCLGTTVLALRSPGLSLSRAPFYAWSVLVASVMWMLTLPVLFGQIILMYVDHRHAGGVFGGDKVLFSQLGWVLKNPQIYAVAIPVLGFAADVMVTIARVRLNARGAVLTAIGAFGALSFGAFLASTSEYVAGSPVTVGIALLAPLPVLAVLAISGDLIRRGKGAVSAGAAYAVAALLLLLLATVAGAIGAIPQTDASGTIFDVGVNHAAVLAAVIGALGGLHWWATKILRQPAKESLGMLAPLLLFLGSVAVVLPDLIAGLWGSGKELTPDWTGGIEGLNVLVLIGAGLVGAGLILALAGLLPALRAGEDVPADPWEGQTLEWLAPSPPPLDNFAGPVPTVTSAEPLIDLREEK